MVNDWLRNIQLTLMFCRPGREDPGGECAATGSAAAPLVEVKDFVAQTVGMSHGRAVSAAGQAIRCAPRIRSKSSRAVSPSGGGPVHTPPAVCPVDSGVTIRRARRYATRSARCT